MSLSSRSILKTALPLALGFLAHNLSGMVDIYFIAHLGSVHQAAVSYAAVCAAILIVGGKGLAQGLQIGVARRVGEQAFSQIADLLYPAALFALIVGGLLAALFVATELHWATFLVSNAELRDIYRDYLQVRLWGLPLILMHQMLQSLFAGLKKTSPVFEAAVVLAITNIALNSVLITGEMGFPALGVRGAAWGTVIAEFVALTYMVANVFLRLPWRHYGLGRIKFWGKLPDVLSAGLPLALLNFLAVASFGVSMYRMEAVSVLWVAVSAVLRQVYLLPQCFNSGFGQTSASVISQLVGQRDLARILPAARRLAGFSLIVCLVIIAGQTVFLDFFLGLFTQDRQLIQEARSIWWLLMLAMLGGSVSHILFSCVAGLGKTLVNLGIELITTILYLAFLLFVTSTPSPSLAAFWYAEVFYVFFLILLCGGYLLLGPWRRWFPTNNQKIPGKHLPVSENLG